MAYTLDTLDKHGLEAIMDAIEASGDLYGVDLAYVTEAKRFAKKVYEAFCENSMNSTSQSWLTQYLNAQQFQTAYSRAIGKSFEKFLSSVSSRQLKKALMGVTQHYRAEIPDFIAIMPIVEESLEKESVYCNERACTQLNVLLPDGTKIPLIGTKDYVRR